MHDGNNGVSPADARSSVRRARRPLLVVATLVAVALAAAGCGGGGSGDGQAVNDPGAAKDLASAASAMQQATGYRFDATVGTAPALIQLVGEFQAPDRLHESIAVGGQPPAEVIFIGSSAFVKDPATGVWRDRVQDPATASTPTDLRAAFTALTKAQAVTRRGATYSFVVPAADAVGLVGSGASAAVQGSAGIEGGYVTKLAYRATVGGRPVEVRVAYTDVGSAPPVEPPAPA